LTPSTTRNEKEKREKRKGKKEKRVRSVQTDAPPLRKLTFPNPHLPGEYGY
jgi:hypothetical protein